MKSGRLRHRADVEENQAVRDSEGGYGPDNWVSIKKKWMAIEPVVGREIVAGQAELSVVMYNIEMRYMSNIKPQHRINHKGTIYEIIDVMPVDLAYKTTKLLARTGASNG